MRILDHGHPIAILRFSDDGSRLIAGSGYQYNPLPQPYSSTLDIWSMTDDSRTVIPLPNGTSWSDPNELVTHPEGSPTWVTINGECLTCDTITGRVISNTESLPAQRVILSPDGKRKVYLCRQGKALELVGREEHGLNWAWPVASEYCDLGGFLQDNDQFVSVFDKRVRIHRFSESGRPISDTSYPSTYFRQLQLSSDRKLLGIIGTTCIYLYDLTNLSRPRRMAPANINGGFRSYSFHPSGQTVAIIHKGPSLVKVYDLNTLKMVCKYQWKLGPLNAVAYSPTGTMAAAGSADGRIILWDLDD